MDIIKLLRSQWRYFLSMLVAGILAYYFLITPDKIDLFSIRMVGVIFLLEFVIALMIIIIDLIIFIKTRDLPGKQVSKSDKLPDFKHIPDPPDARIIKEGEKPSPPPSHKIGK